MMFKVIAVKKKRWWARFSDYKMVVLDRVHKDPNNWPLFGQIKMDVPSIVADEFKIGDVFSLRLDREDG